MLSLTVSGPGVAAAVRKLDAAAAGQLRQDIAAGIRQAATPIPPAIVRNILQRMPHAGGLDRKVAASQFTLKPLNFGSTVGVRLLVGGPLDEASIDKGRIRHPLFGDRGWWYTQKVPTRVFTDPVRAARSDLVGAVDDAVRKNLG